MEQAGSESGPFVFICEHASSRIPAPLVTSVSDRGWLETHWGVDIGARDLTLELASLTNSQAVLARFSRLLCDANRHRDHPDLIRETIEGAGLSFNAGLDDAEVMRRVERYHEPYHLSIHTLLNATPSDRLLISIHSFTPVFNNHLRTMDVGVLFDGAAPHHAEDARRLQHALQEQGFFAALNEPYSGEGGLMYAADRHGSAHGLRHLELEINQAILSTPQRATRVAGLIAPALQTLLTVPSKRDDRA